MCFLLAEREFSSVIVNCERYCGDNLAAVVKMNVITGGRMSKMIGEGTKRE